MHWAVLLSLFFAWFIISFAVGFYVFKQYQAFGDKLNAPKLLGTFRCFSRSMVKMATLLILLSFSVAINISQLEWVTKWWILGLAILLVPFTLMTVIKPQDDVSNERRMFMMAFVLTFSLVSIFVAFNDSKYNYIVLIGMFIVVMAIVWIWWKKYYKEKENNLGSPHFWTRLIQENLDFDKKTASGKPKSRASSVLFTYCIMAILFLSLTVNIIQYASIDDEEDQHLSNLLWSIFILAALIGVIIWSHKDHEFCRFGQNPSQQSQSQSNFSSDLVPTELSSFSSKN